MAKAAPTNAVTVLDQIEKGALPAHLADWGDDGDANIAPKVTVPSISYEGKTWTISLNGEKTKLMRKDEDGELVPLQTFKGVILDYAKRRGRTYYEGAYDPAKPAVPLCWSDDGYKPSATVQKPQCATCTDCPMAVKGSKVTEQGKATTACSQHRMLAVIPAGKLDFEPLRMKLAITSDWDANSPELAAQGWYAFSQFLDQFRAKGVPHTAAIVTKMRFDPNTGFPKVMFAADRWLKPEEVAEVKALWKSDKVKQLLAGSWTPAGVDGTPVADAEDTPAPTPAPVPAKATKAAAAPAATKAPAKATKPAPEPEEDEGEAIMETEEDEGEVEITPPPKATKASGKATTVAAPAKKTKPAPEPAEEDDGEMELPAALDRRSPAVKEAAKASKKAPAKAAQEAPAGLDSLLDEWGGDENE